MSWDLAPHVGLFHPPGAPANPLPGPRRIQDPWPPGFLLEHTMNHESTLGATDDIPCHMPYRHPWDWYIYLSFIPCMDPRSSQFQCFGCISPCEKPNMAGSKKENWFEDMCIHFLRCEVEDLATLKKKNLGVLEVFGASFSSRLSWHQLPKHTFQNEVGNGMFKIHPRKFNSSPLKIGHPKRKVVFQPSYLRDYVKLRGCTSKVKGSPTNWMICFDVSKFFLDVGGAPCFRWTSQSILVCLGIRVAHCLSLFGCASTIP